MPTLADIYSAIDSAKRRGTDFIQNPGTSLQQMLGNANDRARALNEQDRAATDEFLASGQLNGPKQMQSAMDLAGAYNPMGMVVWHGSPASFAKFDPTKMSTGEGRQAYGKGFYMAESKPVAEGYKEGLSKYNTMINGEPLTPNHPNFSAGMSIAANGYDKALKQAEDALASGFVNREAAQKTIDQIKSLQSAKIEQSQGGSLYKVDLPDKHINNMVDFDEPLKNQPQKVRKLAKSLGMDLNDLGGDLLAQIGKGEEGKKILQEAGIPGIKYLDQSSRKAEAGKRNFVVFDPEHLTILERNGKPIK
jgi:hypothetical protein